jgi:2-dehydro-3-deoxy-D-arabinonate dehydratase
VRLVRFRVGRGEPRSGVLDDPGADAAKPAVITALAALDLPDLLGQPLGRIREICQNPGGQTVPADHAVLLAPVSGRTEVWAAGVTYHRSRAARMAESEHSADIYDRVYAAERPELFFKSAAWRVCGPGAPVSVRADSSIDVPEPELAVVLNYAGEVAGYTICNDMSSRSIEGENPLYLPQAKVYLGGCAVGPWIRPAWEVPDPYALTIEMTITRGDAVAWQGTSSTSGLRRRIDELAAYLFREDDFPVGVVLSTGTSLVPDLPFSLQAGDEICIKISEIGELVNPVVRGKAAVAAAVHADASGKLTKDSPTTSSAAGSKVSAWSRAGWVGRAVGKGLAGASWRACGADTQPTERLSAQTLAAVATAPCSPGSAGRAWAWPCSCPDQHLSGPRGVAMSGRRPQRIGQQCDQRLELHVGP